MNNVEIVKKDPEPVKAVSGGAEKAEKKEKNDFTGKFEFKENYVFFIEGTPFRVAKVLRNGFTAKVLAHGITNETKAK